MTSTVTKTPQRSPVLSILTCLKNDRENFRRTSESLPETLPAAVEWVVVDGNSTDGTLDAILAEKRITRYVSEQDSGVYDAYNKALGLAQGSYVWYLNAGDTATPDGIAAALDAASGALDDEALPIICFPVYIETDGVLMIPEPSRIEESMSIPTPGILLPRDALLQMGGFDLCYRIAADFDVLLRLKLLNKHPFVTKPTTLSRYMGGGLSDIHNHLGAVEEIAAQMRRTPLKANDYLFRAIRHGIFNVDIDKIPHRRWRWIIKLARSLGY